MSRHASMLMFLGLLAVINLTSCDRGGPDLVPERRSGGQGEEGFCKRDNDGNLVVRVRNQANQDALNQSTTIVVFTPGEPKSGMTAPMPGGSFSEVTFEIPSECFDPDCDFSITLDANNDIAESNEENNSAKGICIG